MLQCVAVCCSVAQKVNSELQITSTIWPIYTYLLQCVAVCCSVLQCVAVCCSAMQCVAVCCSVMQCVAVCCSVLQCVAVCCSVAQELSSNLQIRPNVLPTYTTVCNYLFSTPPQSNRQPSNQISKKTLDFEMLYVHELQCVL